MNGKDILPFHIFTYQDKSYLINIEKMRADAVDETTAIILKRAAAETEAILPPDMEELFEKLCLTPEAGDERKKIEKNELPPVTDMTLFLTQSCNLRCIYCYGDGGQYGTGGSMKEKTACRAVDWFIEQSGDMKTIHIEFLGGEPLLKFSLMKAVAAYAEERAREAGKKVNFRCITNATLLEDEQIAFIRKHLIQVTVSFDGPREVQDLQRPYANGKGSYEAAVPKIKKLLAVLPDTPAHAVLTGHTELQKVKNALQEIGFKEISVVTASQSLFDSGTEKEKMERDIRDLLHALEQESETWIRLSRSRDREALKELKAQSGLIRALETLLHNSKRLYACGAGRWLVGVSVSGGVYLCHRFVGKDMYKLGTVFDKSLNREEYQSSPAVSNEACAACFARYYCAGGCKHDNLGSTGSIRVPSEDMCQLRRRELELAASVICRLETEELNFLFEHQILTPKSCLLDF